MAAWRMSAQLDIATPAEPPLVTFGTELRAAFQSGDDKRMLDLLLDAGGVGQVVKALNAADDRALTYAAPYIADLAVRLGRVS